VDASNPSLDRQYSEFIARRLGLGSETSGEVLEGYTPAGRTNQGRFGAANKQEAARTGAHWALDSWKYKGEDITDYVQIKPERVGGTDVNVLVKAPGLRMGKSAQLGIDSPTASRRMAAERTLDLTVDALYDRSNTDLNKEDFKKAVIDYSRQNYAQINNWQGKEVHHVMELSTTDDYLQAIADPMQRVKVVNQLVDKGLTPGDVASNFQGLYGESTPGPTAALSDRPNPEFNEHQGGVHLEYDRLTSELGMPGSRTSNPSAIRIPRSVTKQDKNNPYGMKTGEGLYRGIKEATNKTYTVPLAMQGLNNEQQGARALLHGYVSDLARLNTVQDEVSKSDPKVKQRLEDIADAQKVIHGAEEVDFEKNYMKNLGIDVDNYLLRGRTKARK